MATQGTELPTRESGAAGWGRVGGWGQYLGIEDVAGDAAQHEQPVLLHGPGDTQPGHPLQRALVGLIVVTQPPVFLFGGLF